MQTNQMELTPEMLASYERRTKEHIERVRKCLALLAQVTSYGEELIERGKVRPATYEGRQEAIAARQSH
jgi:hypothetical protein